MCFQIGLSSTKILDCFLFNYLLCCFQSFESCSWLRLTSQILLYLEGSRQTSPLIFQSDFFVINTGTCIFIVLIYKIQFLKWDLLLISREERFEFLFQQVYFPFLDFLGCCHLRSIFQKFGTNWHHCFDFD